jgi:hypothetical protein
MKTMSSPIVKQTLLIVVSVLITGLTALGQGGNSNKIKVKDFSAKTIEGKTYINCLILSTVSENIILMEKSTDGEHFETLNTKMGSVSPNNQPLLYSFIDIDSYTSATYRLSSIDNDGVQVLGTITVEGSNQDYLLGLNNAFESIIQ